MPGTHRGQEMVSVTLDWELSTWLGATVWVQRLQPRSPGRAASALHCSAISPAAVLILRQDLALLSWPSSNLQQSTCFVLSNSGIIDTQACLTKSNRL